MSYHASLGAAFFDPSSFTPKVDHLTGGSGAPPKKRGGPVHAGTRRSGASPEVVSLRAAVKTLELLLGATKATFDRHFKSYGDTLARMNSEMSKMAYAIEHAGGKQRRRLEEERVALAQKRATYSRDSLRRQAGLSSQMKKIASDLAAKKRLLSLAEQHQVDVDRRADVARQTADLQKQRDQQASDAADRARNEERLQDERDAFAADRARNEERLQDERDVFDQNRAEYNAQQDSRDQAQADRQAQYDADRSAQAQKVSELQSSGRTMKTGMIVLGVGAVVAIGYAMTRSGK